ncbi:MAG: carboxypeptidase-like regulatory domain-containing protein [Sediminicola sp.]
MKRINITAVLVYFLMVAVLSAQDTKRITGKIVGSDVGEPLVGALIKIPVLGPEYTTVTDSQGTFSFDLPNGTHTLLISYLGYGTREIQMHTTSPELGTISLEISNIGLSEIIVSASPVNFNKDFKGSNYRTGALSIKNNNPLNTEEILRKLPGVNIVGDMGLSNRPNISIRGSWGRRSKKILLMEDGSPAAPAPYIAPGAYYNPISDRVLAIEVYKGADMLRYGPNNMYGAVNYITALPPQKPELRVKLSGGERGYRTALVSYGGTWDKLGALVEGVYKKFDGFTDNSSVELLNLNAKIYAQLSDDQSLYFKVSGQYEDNQASLSALTPFTFDLDPTQNPFDADNFTMRRYGLDIIHKWLITPHTSLTSKIYASDFERDWWRQVNTKIRASEARDYLGDAIFTDRYSYLEGRPATSEDYVRVGRLDGGQESTTDSRWTFRVSGVKETFATDWKAFNGNHKLEVGLKLHQETYKDNFLVANNSRWARTGNSTTDMSYYLWSASGYIRNEFNFGDFGITPIVRLEHIDMYRQNLLALAQDPDLSGLDEGKQKSINNVFLPGVTLSHDQGDGEFFASIYKGFIAPSKVFAFFVERDGMLTNPFLNESVNIEPEVSLNTEIGWRGSLLDNAITGQLTYFNNTVHNFIAGGENEIFIGPGKMNVHGLEIGLDMALLGPASGHGLSLGTNATILASKVREGALQDNDLFAQVVHNTDTRQEFIEGVNENRGAYTLYTQTPEGEAIITANTLTEADFPAISRAVVQLGDDGKDAEAPYTPNVNLSAGLDYSFRDFKAGVSGNYVGSQYTEFMNFRSESADGAIGKLGDFFTLDAYINQDFSLGNGTRLNLFVNGKNLTNRIYKASRLNRAGSGIFPGGFRQLIFGATLQI